LKNSKNHGSFLLERGDHKLFLHIPSQKLEPEFSKKERLKERFEGEMDSFQYQNVERV